MSETMREYAARLATQWDDYAAKTLAEDDDVGVSEISIGTPGEPSHYTLLRFLLPTGDTLDWHPDRGWVDPPDAIRALARRVDDLQCALEISRGRRQAAQDRVDELELDVARLFAMALREPGPADEGAGA